MFCIMKNYWGGIDSYDVYLSGASSVIKIYNDNSKTDRKLVLIRDSFGSSLAPLLVGNYSVITLVDFRYINFDLVNDLVDFDGADVLILYSTLVVNDSGSLKIY